MTTIAHPSLAIVAAGEMGAAVAARLTRAGCTVYTDLDGRSEATRRRAKQAGMIDASLTDIVVKADWDAVSFANKIRDVDTKQAEQGKIVSIVFVNCNAVSPETVKGIAGVFVGSGIKFVDAGIIGGPPREGYDPTFYASAAAVDGEALDAFMALSKYGLKVSPLQGEGAGVGDASALKMSYAASYGGAAHASSPATAEVLMRELSISQPDVLSGMVKKVPAMLPKAHRWVGEMGEIGEFAGGKEGDVYRGLSRVYERVEKSLDGDQADVEVLRKFIEDARKLDR